MIYKQQRESNIENRTTYIRSNLIVIPDGFKSKMLPNKSGAIYS